MISFKILQRFYFFYDQNPFRFTIIIIRTKIKLRNRHPGAFLKLFKKSSLIASFKHKALHKLTNYMVAVGGTSSVAA